MNPQQLQKMMKQAQKLQGDMQKAQAELEAREYNNQAGGGAISITMLGNKKITALDINADMLDPEEKEMLQDLLVSLVNSTTEMIDAESEKVMGQYTQGLPF